MLIDMNALARAGAQIRLTELAVEMDSIRGAFPELGAPPGKKRGRPAVAPIDGGVQARQRQLPPRPPEALTRKRQPMSAAAKKAIGERMRKYWAGRKGTSAAASHNAAETEPVKVEAKAEPKRSIMSAEARAKISAAQKRRWAAHRRAAKRRSNVPPERVEAAYRPS
jgi:hypothetical protein